MDNQVRRRSNTRALNKLKACEERGKAGLLIFAAVAVLLIAGGAWFFLSKPAATEVAVIVTAPSGERVSANIALYEGDVELDSVAATNGSAVFRNLPQGRTLRVVASKRGYAPKETTFVAGKKSVVLLVFEEKTRVQRQTGKADFLIVTSKSRLEAKYGFAAAGEVIAKMQELAETVELTENLSTAVVLLDDQESMNEFNASAVQSTSQESILAAVNVLVLKAEPKYLLIVGGENIVPFQRIQNPLIHGRASDAFQFIWQTDQEVLTDNPYAIASLDSKCSNCLPDIAVGRLPDGLESTAEGDSSLAILLDNAITAHNTRPSFSYASKTISSDSYYNYLNQLPFETISHLTIVPPFFLVKLIGLLYSTNSVSELRERFKSNTAFLSLHGNEPLQEQALEGRERGSTEGFLVLTPPLANSIDYSGKIVLADSCYGASPLRNKTQSLPILFLEKKARVFVGSTMTALSDNKITFESADEDKIRESGVSNSFAYFFMKGLSEGKRVGDAFKDAKRQLDATKEVDQLTVLEYVLYGDPTLATARRTS